jgi:hypothetical protein
LDKNIKLLLLMWTSKVRHRINNNCRNKTD